MTSTLTSHSVGTGCSPRAATCSIAASGYAVHEALQALATLSEEGIKAGLIDLYSLPFDGEAIAQSAQASGGRVVTVEDSGGKVVTVEDNYGAGFGSEVAEALLDHGGDFKVKQMYVKRIPKSGRSADDLMTYVGLSAGDIVAEARGLVE